MRIGLIHIAVPRIRRTVRASRIDARPRNRHLVVNPMTASAVMGEAR
jgi:hypothetical protein